MECLVSDCESEMVTPTVLYYKFKNIRICTIHFFIIYKNFWGGLSGKGDGKPPMNNKHACVHECEFEYEKKRAGQDVWGLCIVRLQSKFSVSLSIKNYKQALGLNERGRLILLKKLHVCTPVLSEAHSACPKIHNTFTHALLSHNKEVFLKTFNP